jgi:hypothetical protein
VLLAINFLTLIVLTVLDARLFTRAHMAIRSGSRLSSIDARLTPFQV